MLEPTLRRLVWASALAGVLIAFAWPFAISPDPGLPALHAAGVAIAAAFFAALAALVVVRARASR